MALFSVVFVAQIGVGIISPMMPLYAESMGATGLWLGIMFSSFAFARLIFMPITGRLSDMRGRKGFMTIGLSAYTLISLCYAWAPSIILLTLVRFLHGLASCMVIPIAQAYVGDLTPKGKEGTYINFLFMAMFTGMGCGPFLGGLLTKSFSMEAAFYGMTAVSSLALGLLLFSVPAGATPVKVVGERDMASMKTIILDRRVLAAGIFRFSRAFWRQGIMAFLPLLAISTFHMSPADLGLVLSVYLLTGGGAQGLVGPFVNRVNRSVLIGMGGIISPVLILFIPYAHTGTALVATLLPVAILGAFARGALQAINVETGRRHRAMGAVMGVIGSIGGLGMLAGPILFGYTMDTFDLNWGFIIGGVIGVIGGLVTTYLLSERPFPEVNGPQAGRKGG